MEGWHFLRETKTLGYDDGRIVVVGETLTVDGEPELCEWGLHASKRAIDALQYAPGPIVCRVDVGGKIIEGDDKFVGTSRKVLWMADATKVLHEFACWCAERALIREREAGREPDPSSWNAIEAARAWNRGEATYEELYAARGAASLVARRALDNNHDAATWDVTGAGVDAASHAAYSATCCVNAAVACSTTWVDAAAGHAAIVVAWCAAAEHVHEWNPELKAEREEQNAKLEEMLWSLKEDA